MKCMIGQRSHKKEFTDTPKASLGTEMDGWDASPRPKNQITETPRTSSGMNDTMKAKKSSRAQKPPGGSPPAQASRALPGYIYIERDHI